MKSKIKVLFIGDVVGRTGRLILRKKWSLLSDEYAPDFLLCNGENSAGGLGINAKTARELLDIGVDGISLGNHTWARREWIKQAYDFKKVCRPINGPKDWPGFDHVYIQKDQVGLVLINLMGQAFIQPVLENPFLIIVNKIQELKEKYKTKNIIIDFHAETTAEKIMMGYFLQDKVSAVLGTHTHVQTADERILGYGTGFITDVGMTGPADGILGMEKKIALSRVRDQLPAAYKVDEGDRTILNGVLLTIDSNAGQCLDIKRIQLEDNIYD